MIDKNTITPLWIDSVISNDRDILKLSSAGVIFIGTMLQFITLPMSARAIIISIYAFSALAFLISLFTAIYKLQLNSDLLFLVSVEKKGKEYDDTKRKLKRAGQIMSGSFMVAIIATVFLIFSLLAIK